MSKSKKTVDSLPKSKFNNNHKGRMKILLAMKYKDCFVYVRKIDRDLFIWDAVFEGQLYSSYMIITPPEGKELTDKEIAQATEMCYAGAAATIDLQLGEELTNTQKQNVKTFEKGRTLEEINRSHRKRGLKKLASILLN